jgi:hypothetical protein
LTRTGAKVSPGLGGDVTCVVANERARTVRGKINGVAVEPPRVPASDRAVNPALPAVPKRRSPTGGCHQPYFPNPLADLTLFWRLKVRSSSPTGDHRQAGLMGLYRPR